MTGFEVSGVCRWVGAGEGNGVAEMVMVCSLRLQTDFRYGRIDFRCGRAHPLLSSPGLPGPGLSTLCRRGWLWLLRPLQLAFNLETFCWRLSRHYRWCGTWGRVCLRLLSQLLVVHRLHSEGAEAGRPVCAGAVTALSGCLHSGVGSPTYTSCSLTWVMEDFANRGRLDVLSGASCHLN